jgi:hypothetical protein
LTYGVRFLLIIVVIIIAYWLYFGKMPIFV